MGNDVCLWQSDWKTCDSLYCCGLVKPIVSTEMPTPYFKTSRPRQGLCIGNLIIFRTSIISKAIIKMEREKL